MEPGASAVAEAWLTVAMLLSLSFAVARERPSARCWLTGAGLFAAALCARCLVPWVPANFYSDLGAPYPTFQVNASYASPLYAGVWALSDGPDAPFYANVLVGSLTAPLFALALRGAEATRRLALPFGLAVALLPLYVRLSASDAPHVYGLFLFAVAALHVRRALERPLALDLIGVGVAAFLVGATRRELAANPLLLAFLAPLLAGRSALEPRRLAVVGVLVAGSVGGGFLSHLARVGTLNADLSLSARSVGAYVDNLPSILLGRSAVTPLLFTLATFYLLADSLRRRQFGVPVAYALGAVVATAPYALVEPFAHSVGSPFFPWSFSRYALVWSVFPLFFGVWGVVRLLELVAAFRFRLALYVLGALLCWNVAPSYVGVHAYQAEYRFLRRHLATVEPSGVLMAGWQKNAGWDLAESLALPYFALGARRYAISDAEGAPQALVGRSGVFLYFQNSLVGLKLDRAELARMGMAEDDFVEAERAMDAFTRLGCVARARGEVIAEERGIRVEPLQFFTSSDATVDLALLRVDAARVGEVPEGCR